MRAFLERHVPNAKSLIGQMAAIATLTDEGFISSDRLQKLAIAGNSTSEESAESGEAGVAGKSKGKRGEKAAPETASPQGRLLGLLRNAGILVRYRDDRYQFKHGSWQPILPA